jgi:hypothetical protein
VPRYRNIGNDKRDYVRGFGYQGGGSRAGWNQGSGEKAFGADMKVSLINDGPVTLLMDTKNKV